MDPTRDPTMEQKPARRARGVFVVSDEAGRLWARWADHHPKARDAGPTQQDLAVIQQALRRHPEERLAAVVDWVHRGTDPRARWLQRERHTALRQVFALPTLDERVELAADHMRGLGRAIQVDEAWVEEEADRQFVDLADGMARAGVDSVAIAAAREDLRREIRRQAGMEARG